MADRKNIIVVSNEAWGDMWYSKHHYAYELNKTNEVFFIDPPAKWNFRNLFKREISERRIYAHLSILSYHNLLPSFFLKWNNRIVSKRIRKFLERKGFVVDLFWTFDPYRLYDPELLGANKSIFHVVDKYLFTHPAEVPLHNNVNGFVFVAEEFKKQYEHYRKPSIVIPHGISVDEYSNENSEIPDIPYENYLLYMGMIDGRLDYDLIVKMVERFNEEIFVFLGDFKRVEDPHFHKLFIEKKYKNLIHIPGVHSLKLKFYLEKSKACLAPMWDGWAGNMISHHKVMQYMSYGKAVFSPVFSAYVGFSELLYMTAGHDEFLNKLERFLNNGEESGISERRIELAKGNSYESHVKNIFDFISKIHESKHKW